MEIRYSSIPAVSCPSGDDVPSSSIRRISHSSRAGVEVLIQDPSVTKFAFNVPRAQGQLQMLWHLTLISSCRTLFEGTSLSESPTRPGIVSSSIALPRFSFCMSVPPTASPDRSKPGGHRRSIEVAVIHFPLCQVCEPSLKGGGRIRPGDLDYRCQWKLRRVWSVPSYMHLLTSSCMGGPRLFRGRRVRISNQAIHRFCSSLRC
jgi:hypothetical protein